MIEFFISWPLKISTIALLIAAGVIGFFGIIGKISVLK